MDKKQSVLKNFLTYIKIDTQSDETSETVPSTAKQLNLAKVLMEEIKALGITDVELDDKGYIYGKLKGNIDAKVPTIAFIAHMDTALEFPYPGDEARVIENYDGEPIVLCEDVVLDPANNPPLLDAKGKTVVVTNGKTLLGGDDKAGVAEIMTALEYMIKTPEFKHGDIAFSFTPDEEIGTSVDNFDVKKLAADRAYTLDGAAPDEISYENFNAASAKLTVNGRNIHPGYAKGKMVNSLQVVCDLHALLPEAMRPEATAGYEGFFHLIGINGSVEKASASYIIRDHDRKLFEEKKELIKAAIDYINRKYGSDIVSLELKDQYYNMREMVEPHPEIIEKAIAAMKLAGVTARIQPIRGGTDGARLSYMGLPCPNIFAGGMNFHGKFEYCSLDSMRRAVDTICHLAALWAE